jgi:hypothetical protein
VLYIYKKLISEAIETLITHTHFLLSKNKRSIMKLYTVFLALVLVTLFQNNAFSQIPNAGFENWTNGEPDNWFTNNNLGLGTPVTQSPESHSGSSAIKLEVVSTMFGVNYPGQIWSGTENLFEGFPVSQAYGSLNGYYKFSKAGDDVFYVVVYVLKNGGIIGGGTTVINTSTSGYTQFVVPIAYIQTEVPDTASIYITISDSSDGMVSLGTYALIDDLAFGSAVSVDDKMQAVQTFSLKQNYPNPFNPTTKINFSITEQSYVELTVYDLLGRKVERLVSDNYPAGNYSVDFSPNDLPSGIYIAKMSAGKFSKAIKMTLLK